VAVTISVFSGFLGKTKFALTSGTVVETIQDVKYYCLLRRVQVCRQLNRFYIIIAHLFIKIEIFSRVTNL
jgi:hypothetical protein